VLESEVNMHSNGVWAGPTWHSKLVVEGRSPGRGSGAQTPQLADGFLFFESSRVWQNFTLFPVFCNCPVTSINVVKMEKTCSHKFVGITSVLTINSPHRCMSCFKD